MHQAIAYYRHPLSRKWADIGKPVLIRLLDQKSISGCSIFHRVFVGDTEPSSRDHPKWPALMEPMQLSDDAYNTVLDVIEYSTSLAAVGEAFRLLHNYTMHDGGDGARAVHAVVSFLSRWTLRENVTSRAILEMMNTLTLHENYCADLEKEQLASLVDWFAMCLSELGEPNIRQILSYLSRWLGDSQFAEMFFERHGFPPLLRLLELCSMEDKHNSTFATLVNLIRTHVGMNNMFYELVVSYPAANNIGDYSKQGRDIPHEQRY